MARLMICFVVLNAVLVLSETVLVLERSFAWAKKFDYDLNLRSTKPSYAPDYEHKHEHEHMGAAGRAQAAHRDSRMLPDLRSRCTSFLACR